MSVDRSFLVLCALFLIMILTMIGCAKKVVYKEVLVPTKCDIQIPQEPTLNGDVLHDLAESLAHSEKLENSLRFCIGE